MPADVAWPLWTLTVSAGGDAFVVASTELATGRHLIVRGAATGGRDSQGSCFASRKNMEPRRCDGILSRALLMS